MSETFQLRTPVDGVTELTLDEPTVAEIKKLSADTAKHGAVEALVLLIAGQSQLPAGTINKLKARDFKVIEKWYGAFFDEPQAASTT